MTTARPYNQIIYKHGRDTGLDSVMKGTGYEQQTCNLNVGFIYCIHSFYTSFISTYGLISKERTAFCVCSVSEFVRSVLI